jgi:hypothetical protein
MKKTLRAELNPLSERLGHLRRTMFLLESAERLRRLRDRPAKEVGTEARSAASLAAPKR